MKETDRRLLEMIGLDTGSNEFLVFEAIMQATDGGRTHTVYSDLRSHVDELSNDSFTKAYIYRCLKSLEMEGLVQVDAVHHPKRFSVNQGELAKTIERMSSDRLTTLEMDRDRIRQDLEHLNNTNISETAIMLANELGGTRIADSSIMIEGIQNVRQTLIREIADCAKPGDTVRVLAFLSTLAEGLGPSGITEVTLMQVVFKGVKVLGLLIPQSKDSLDLSLMANHVSTVSSDFIRGLATGNLGLRLGSEPVKTYRMVSLNDEKMLLYLTHAMSSDVAALVYRKDNPGLIDDAIRTFDSLWDNGRDVIELVAGMLDEQKPD